jgi:hypothetical protein
MPPPVALPAPLEIKWTDVVTPGGIEQQLHST